MEEKIIKSAGRVSITPMGDYDDTTMYRRLDLVKYGGTSYICRKNNTCGISPFDTEHWQKIIDELDTERYLNKYGGDAKNVIISDFMEPVGEVDEMCIEVDTDGRFLPAFIRRGKLYQQFNAIRYCFEKFSKVASSGEYSDLLGRLTLTNNLLATTPGTALDAAQGKALDDKDTNLQNQINQINSDLGGFSINSEIDARITDANDAIMGVYQLKENSLNAPFVFWSTIVSFKFRGDWMQQICFPWSNLENRIAYRTKDENRWSKWHYINYT